LANKIIKEYGDDPQKWLPIFHEQVKLGANMKKVA
jgi:type IV secretory pathway VirB4 component